MNSGEAQVTRRLLNEARQGRHDQQAAERHRHFYAQPAARNAARLGHFAFGLVQLAQGFAATVVEAGAEVGQTERARGAVQQARAETLFQPADGLADRRGGHSKRLGGRNETVGLHDAYKSDDVTETVQAIPISQEASRRPGRPVGKPPCWRAL
jgi:hypothetical protein